MYGIILHHTGSSGSGRTVWKNLTIFLSSKDKVYVSTHYTVGDGGEVAKIGEDTNILWHVGMGKHPHFKNGRETNLNPYFIGIEIVSNGYHFTEKQREKVDELCVYLCEKYNIPVGNILRHADVSGYRGKWDVGGNFFREKYENPMGNFRENIQKKLSENSEKREKESLEKSRRYLKKVKRGFDKMAKISESLITSKNTQDKIKNSSRMWEELEKMQGYLSKSNNILREM